ncbi:MAG: hypothetical protein B9S30_00965 [Verrucomicrobiia bacterium Tous-C5FEB]|nr:MAG: hypothetical protein B9S30_00965 [Verrucomicrobiae bacterium Tous-C5FEB]
MNGIQKSFFVLCMLLSLATMLAGHWFIWTSGAWFIPGKEKYNIFTRWVSDYAALWPQGLWIKGSIVLFCLALLIFKGAKRRACGEGAIGHARWGWNVLLTAGLIAGLLLVVLYDMSPPQYTTKEPSWLGKMFGDRPRIVERPRDAEDYTRQWHHRLGFQIFIFSFAATLLTSVMEKLRIRDVLGVRRDVVFLILTALFMSWLFAFHNSLAGVPQRVLLILIFMWVCREGWSAFRKVDTRPSSS